MSIESVRARISEIAARRGEVIKKPETVFKNVLQEKLGIVPPDSGAESAEESSAAENAADLYLSAALQNNALGLQDNTFLQNYISAQQAAASYTSGGSSNIALQAQPYMSLIQSASEKYSLPANLIMGIIKAESDFNPNSVSYAGAMGLMQLMPANAQEAGLTDPFDPAQNIDAGCGELARYLDNYGGDLKLALAAYNTGPGNVAKRGVTSSQSEAYLTIPQSIRDYVDRVLKYAGYQIY